MATEVNPTVEVKLEDDAKVVLKPLVIKDLRKFMATWNAWIEKVMDIQRKRAENADAEDRGDEPVHKKVPTIIQTNDMEYDVYIDLLEICLSKQIRGDLNDEEYRDYIENNVSTPVLYKTLKVCGNLDLEDNQEDENLQ